LALNFLFVDDLMIYVDESVQLVNRENIEVLMQKEKLILMKVLRILDTLHNNVHHFLVHVRFFIQINDVYDHCDTD